MSAWTKFRDTITGAATTALSITNPVAGAALSALGGAGKPQTAAVPPATQVAAVDEAAKKAKEEVDRQHKEALERIKKLEEEGVQDDRMIKYLSIGGGILGLYLLLKK